MNVVQSENMALLETFAYKDQRMQTEDPLASNYRYYIRTGDLSRLFRDHLYEAYGIDVEIAAEHNIHNWLNSQSQSFRQSIYSTVFYYAARTSKHERFKLCISTPEMREAAWQYCHKQQIVIDGTFGISNCRLLLWIAMGIDELGHGLPVALFLFSASTGAQATHGSYNTAILAELLGAWNTWLGIRDGESFEPYAAMTDTDFKERGALATVWAYILLLLCRFHIRQCWTNKRRVLRLSGGLSHLRTVLRAQLLSMEEA